MPVINDALDALFLGCFLFGLLFAVVSLLLGVADLEINAGPLGGGDGETGSHDSAGPINVSTVLAFIAWFGGTGYLVRNGFGWISMLSVVVAVAGGLAGAALIYQFLVKVVAPADQALDPADYRLPGTLARVTSSIRTGGTGEIVYEQAGFRQVSAARASDGGAIGRGTEVVVLEADRGIALVQPWDTLVGHDDGIIETPGDGIETGAARERPRSGE